MFTFTYNIYVVLAMACRDNTKKLCGCISIVVPQKKFLFLFLEGER